MVLLMVAGAGGGTAYWRFAVHPFESTDNTYLKAYMTQVSPRESGYVRAVLFENNQSVRAGDLLVVIDDADLKARLAEGEAQMAVERAQITSLEADKRTQDSLVRQGKAEIAAVEADLERAARDFRRFGNLVNEGAISVQSQDAADATLKQARARSEKARLAYQEAQNRLSALDARIAEAQARIGAIEAAMAQVRIALSHTQVVAPLAGVLGNRSVQLGQYVKPGSVLAYLIPADGLFVEANFKETQIGRMKVGQPVEVRVDAFPDRIFEGVVESFAPASGSEFSLLPPENATGNFTKIVRRVPVRIGFRPGASLDGLKPGLSAAARVRVE